MAGAADLGPARVAELDASDMLGAIAGLPRQLSEGYAAARGASRLARLFSLVQLGDYASFYLALLYGVDPTPVDAIEALKARLVAAGD